MLVFLLQIWFKMLNPTHNSTTLPDCTSVTGKEVFPAVKRSQNVKIVEETKKCKNLDRETDKKVVLSKIVKDTNYVVVWW